MTSPSIKAIAKIRLYSSTTIKYRCLLLQLWAPLQSPSTFLWCSRSSRRSSSSADERRATRNSSTDQTWPRPEYRLRFSLATNQLQLLSQVIMLHIAMIASAFPFALRAHFCVYRTLLRMRTRLTVYEIAFVFSPPAEVFPFFAELQTGAANGVFSHKVKIFSASRSAPSVWERTYYRIDPTSLLLETTEVSI